MQFTVKFDLKCMFGYLIFQIFLEGMPPDPLEKLTSLSVLRTLYGSLFYLCAPPRGGSRGVSEVSRNWSGKIEIL